MIRNFRQEDLPFIQDIANRAWRNIFEMFKQTYGKELFDIIFPDPGERVGKHLQLHCKDHPEWVRICEEEGRIAGFITFHTDHDKKIGHIGYNAVDPECGLKGIGQQMYKAVLDYFRAEGMRYAAVLTGLDEAHAKARRAYERAGFNLHHEDVNYYIKL
jgi:ribosomal protein S18 acetylase RimI-like enzyme